MTWVKIDDSFYDNPKIIAAGQDGASLYLAALCYVNKHNTRGFLPAYTVATLAGKVGVSGVKEAIKRLTTIHRPNKNPLWRVVQDGYEIHDYHEYQLSKEEVEDIREKRRLAGQKGGMKSAETRSKRSKIEANGEAFAYDEPEANEANPEALASSVEPVFFEANEAKLNPGSRVLIPDSRIQSPDDPTPAPPTPQPVTPSPPPPAVVSESSSGRSNSSRSGAVPGTCEADAPEMPPREFIAAVLSAHPEWEIDLKNAFDGEENIRSPDAWKASVLKRWLRGDGTPSPSPPKAPVKAAKALPIDKFNALKRQRQERIERLLATLPQEARDALESDVWRRFERTEPALAATTNREKPSVPAQKAMAQIRDALIERDFCEQLMALDERDVQEPAMAAA